MTEQEYESREAALDLLLDCRLGPPPTTGEGLNAEFVMMPFWLKSADLGAMNARREREQLLNIFRLAKQFAAAWKNLHPDVRIQMVMNSSGPLELDHMYALDDCLEAAKSVANEVIDSAPQSGRRDLLNVGIVERLRAVWAERNGKAAPTSMTEAGPFADYMFEAFQILGLKGNPRAALDSWREFRAKYPLPE